MATSLLDLINAKNTAANQSPRLPTAQANAPVGLAMLNANSQMPLPTATAPGTIPQLLPNSNQAQQLIAQSGPGNLNYAQDLWNMIFGRGDTTPPTSNIRYTPSTTPASNTSTNAGIRYTPTGMRYTPSTTPALSLSNTGNLPAPTPEDQMRTALYNSILSQVMNGGSPYDGVQLPNAPQLSAFPQAALDTLGNTTNQALTQLGETQNARGNLLAQLMQGTANAPRVVEDIRRSVNEVYGNGQGIRRQANQALLDAAYGRNTAIADLANRFVNSDGTINPQVLAAAEAPLRTQQLAAQNLNSLATTSEGTIQDIINRGIQSFQAQQQAQQMGLQALDNKDNAVLRMMQLAQAPVQAQQQAAQFNNQVAQQQYQNQLSSAQTQASINEQNQQRPLQQLQTLVTVEELQKQTAKQQPAFLEKFYTLDAELVGTPATKTTIDTYNTLVKSIANGTGEYAQFPSEQRQALLDNARIQLSSVLNASGKQTTARGIEQRQVVTAKIADLEREEKELRSSLKSKEPVTIYGALPSNPQGTIEPYTVPTGGDRNKIVQDHLNIIDVNLSELTKLLGTIDAQLKTS